MSSTSQALRDNDTAIRVVTLSQRLLPLGYFTAVAVAMAGWLWGLGWVTLTAVKWLIV